MVNELQLLLVGVLVQYYFKFDVSARPDTLLVLQIMM